jgi:hypothetical protein
MLSVESRALHPPLSGHILNSASAKMIFVNRTPTTNKVVFIYFSTDINRVEETS